MWKKFLLLSGLAVILSGCNLFGFNKDEEKISVAAPEALQATATIIDTKGNEIGHMEMTERDDGVQISLGVKGLSEGGHGFHIHEVGKCEKPTFESAGAHFNPTGKKHGTDNPAGPHLGDLPNITPEEDGNVQVELVAKDITLKPGKENSIIDEDGSAIVIHQHPDDYVTDPSGNSGDRIACGVITLKN